MYIFDKLIGSLAKKGNKERVICFLSSVLSELKYETKKPTSDIGRVISDNCSSVIELVQPNTRGKKKIKIPSYLSFIRSKRLAAKSLAKACFKGHTIVGGMLKRLSIELNDALLNKGFAVRFKYSLYDFVLGNKVFLRKMVSLRKKKKRRRKRVKRF